MRHPPTEQSRSANCNVSPIDPSKSQVGTLKLDLGYISYRLQHLKIGDRTMPATLNTPRSEALRGAPLDSWVALAEDETRIVATGATYEEVSKRLDEAGDKDSVILKTPKSWLTFSI